MKRTTIQLFKRAILRRLRTYFHKICPSLPYLNELDCVRLGKKVTLLRFSKLMVYGVNEEPKDASIFIGNHVHIGQYSELHTQYDQRIIIKDYTTMNDFNKIIGSVTIERNCLLASNIFMSTGKHEFLLHAEMPIKDQDNLQKTPLCGSIHIEEDCWLGWGVVVMPGIYIGKGAIVGSNAVVTRDIMPYTINVGVPAKSINQRLHFNPNLELNAVEKSSYPYFYRGFALRKHELTLSLQEKVILMEHNSVVISSKNIIFDHVYVKGKNYYYDSVTLIFKCRGMKVNFILPSGYFELVSIVEHDSLYSDSIDIGKKLLSEYCCWELNVINDTYLTYPIGIEKIGFNAVS